MNIKSILVNGYVHICRKIFGVNKNKVMFESFSGKSYSDNPRAVSEMLHSINQDIEIVWSFKDPESKKRIVPNYVKCINKNNKLRFLKEYATCASFVKNFSFSYIPKGAKQYFVQTWHGDRAFKKVLHDSGYYKPGQRCLPEQIDGFCDLAVAGSDYGESQYRTAFLYKGEILKVGTPRDDCLVNVSDEKKRRIRESLNIPEDIHIVMYAPTLRRAASDVHAVQETQDLDISKVLEVLDKNDNGKWICLVRAHSAVAGIGGINYGDKVIDVSSYEDMADLLLISDILITDYSSSAGDFALLGKLLILYQSDREKYEENDRGFYFNMNDSPYYVAMSTNEIINIIENSNQSVVRKNCDAILDFYKTNETGMASKYVCERIINHLNRL